MWRLRHWIFGTDYALIPLLGSYRVARVVHCPDNKKMYYALGVYWDEPNVVPLTYSK